MNKNIQKNTPSKAQIKRDAQRNRTREDNSRLFNRRWSKTKIKEIKALNDIYPGRNSFKFLLNPYVTSRNISEPKKNYININITPVYAHARTRETPQREKTRQKSIKLKTSWKKRSLSDIPQTIANLPFSKLVSKIDRAFGSNNSQKDMQKLRVFSEEALRYAWWAYESYPHHKARHSVRFGYFLVTAINFSRDNGLRLDWKKDYYAYA